MSKKSARKNRYYNLYKKDFSDTDKDKDDIFITLPTTPIKWIKYTFECKEDEEIVIDIGTGKASVRKCKED